MTGNLVQQIADPIESVRCFAQLRVGVGIKNRRAGDEGIRQMSENDLPHEIADGRRPAAGSDDQFAPFAGCTFKIDARGEFLAAVITFVSGHGEWLEVGR